eukprot:TRINITY_DN13785_c0_g1_i1.p1 TRINITY_DN13785_c0_g1~~TRINITY_DN13785_c0_g1_i1.p1  ORF type:complete len:457 (-),score=172.38 TRINITY_DN13785_c0_g1_i1:436-1806(-)
MLRSLVGSEMCIRDSINAEYGERNFLLNGWSRAMTDDRVSPRRVPVIPSQSCADMIAMGKKEAQIIADQNDAMLESLDEQQQLIVQLVESRTVLRDSCDGLKDALEHEQALRLEADQKLRHLEDASGNFTELAQQADERSKELESQLATALAEIGQLQKDLTSSQQAAQEHVEKLAQAEGDKAELGSELAKTREELRQQQESTATSTQENSILSGKLKTAEAQAALLKDLWTQRDELEGENADLHQQLSAAIAEGHELGRRVKELVDQAEEMGAALAQAKAAAGSSEGDVHDLQWRAEAAEQANATLQTQVKEKLGQAEGRMRKSDARIAELEKQCEGQAKQLRTAKGSTVEMRDTIAGLEERLAKAEAKMNEEAVLRKREAKRAKDAESRSRRLEGKIQELEGSLKSVEDGMGMMRTIAKIRNLEDGELPVGFDAVGERTMGLNKGGKAKSGRRR